MKYKIILFIITLLSCFGCKEKIRVGDGGKSGAEKKELNQNAKSSQPQNNNTPKRNLRAVDLDGSNSGSVSEAIELNGVKGAIHKILEDGVVSEAEQSYVSFIMMTANGESSKDANALALRLLPHIDAFPDRLKSEVLVCIEDPILELKTGIASIPDTSQISTVLEHSLKRVNLEDFDTVIGLLKNQKQRDGMFFTIAYANLFKSENIDKSNLNLAIQNLDKVDKDYVSSAATGLRMRMQRLLEEGKINEDLFQIMRELIEKQ